MTAVVVLAILWLTLAPKPLPDSDVHWFEGADKVVHGCMFGGLFFVMGLDWVISGLLAAALNLCRERWIWAGDVTCGILWPTRRGWL